MLKPGISCIRKTKRNWDSLATFFNHFKWAFLWDGVNAILFPFFPSFPGFHYFLLFLFIISIPTVSYCKIFGLFLSYFHFSINTYLPSSFLLSLTLLSLYISSRRICFKMFHQRRYADFMYHFFNQALHVGTDIGAGFILSQGLSCCVFVWSYFWTSFILGCVLGWELGGQVKSYGNVKCREWL